MDCFFLLKHIISYLPLEKKVFLSPFHRDTCTIIIDINIFFELKLFKNDIIYHYQDIVMFFFMCRGFSWNRHVK
ncbi:hypothetical protein HanIR_Chr13g0618021 [Helianthus annuus]|nr:hypothetical protein HanIR_Chr13g0618021 [Helianthus annuus]